MSDFVAAIPVQEGADMTVIEQKRKALEESILAAIEEGVRRGYAKGYAEASKNRAWLPIRSGWWVLLDDGRVVKKDTLEGLGIYDFATPNPVSVMPVLTPDEPAPEGPESK